MFSDHDYENKEWGATLVKESSYLTKDRKAEPSEENIRSCSPLNIANHFFSVKVKVIRLADLINTKVNQRRIPKMSDMKMPPQVH